MKKKIKDITFFDLNEICLKNQSCRSCPLRITYEGETGCITGVLYSNTQTFDWSRIIEQEVDV